MRRHNTALRKLSVLIIIGSGVLVRAPLFSSLLSVERRPAEPVKAASEPLRQVFEPASVAAAAEVPASEPAPVEAPRHLSRHERANRIVPRNEAERALLAAAIEFNVPFDVALALATQESGLNPNAVSHSGARGLCQLMPGTARGIAIELGLVPRGQGMSFNIDRLFDPYLNARFGMYYLRTYWVRENDLERALRSYNAGPNAIDSSYNFPETNAYVRSIMRLKDQIFEERAP